MKRSMLYRDFSIDLRSNYDKLVLFLVMQWLVTL